MSQVLVRDVMVDDVAYVTIPGSRDKVLETLKDRWVSGVPVVKKGAVVGIVTRSDILRNPEEEQIALLMARNPVLVSPVSTVVGAAKLMAEHSIRRLPVVEDGTLVGVITIADVVRVVADTKIETPIEDYMENTLVAVWSEMPLPLVGAVMEYADAQACPVLDSNLMLVGIVSDRDLINATMIRDYVEKSNMAAASDEDEWTWDSTRDTMSLYYGVSRIELKDVPVKDAMVPAITAIKSSEIGECARVMRRELIDQMPVVNAHQKLIGMLRDRDLLRALIDYQEKEQAGG
ncbi:MAG: CBS domain-containing protein [Methanotrichaceae archaeon]